MLRAAQCRLGDPGGRRRAYAIDNFEAMVPYTICVAKNTHGYSVGESEPDHIFCDSQKSEDERFFRVPCKEAGHPALVASACGGMDQEYAAIVEMRVTRTVRGNILLVYREHLSIGEAQPTPLIPHLQPKFLGSRNPDQTARELVVPTESRDGSFSHNRAVHDAGGATRAQC